MSVRESTSITLTVIEDGRPVSAARLAKQLIQAANTLFTETGSLPDALWESIFDALELAVAELPRGGRGVWPRC